jgi:hypothetical protein
MVVASAADDQPSLFDDGDPGLGATCDEFDPGPWESFHELIDAGWDPGDYGDPETDPDDEESWLAVNMY